MLNTWPVNTIQPTTYGVRRHVQMLCQRGLADDTTFPVIIEQLLQTEQRTGPLAGIWVATLPFGPVTAFNFGLSFHWSGVRYWWQLNPLRSVGVIAKLPDRPIVTKSRRDHVALR